MLKTWLWRGGFGVLALASWLKTLSGRLPDLVFHACGFLDLDSWFESNVTGFGFLNSDSRNSVPGLGFLAFGCWL